MQACFQSQMEALMFIIPQIFFATPTVLKVGEYSWILGNIRSCDAFKRIACKQKYLMDYIEDITRWRDMNFIFEWQNNIL